jgi:kinesin family protein 11
MIPVIFNDAPAAGSDEVTTPSEQGDRKPIGGLREIDVNINAGSLSSEHHQNAQDGVSGSVKPLSSTDPLPQLPSFKRSTSATGKLPLPKSAKKAVIALEGRENVLFSQSTGRRRSPRTG